MNRCSTTHETLVGGWVGMSENMLVDVLAGVFVGVLEDVLAGVLAGGCVRGYVMLQW